MISFSGTHFPKDVILHAVFFYLRYAVSYRDLEEIMETAFFMKAIQNNGFPDKVVIDKSGANLAGLENMNCLLIMNGRFWLIDILQVKYLNNIIEQDHRFIKKLTKQMIQRTFF